MSQRLNPKCDWAQAVCAASKADAWWIRCIVSAAKCHEIEILLNITPRAIAESLRLDGERSRNDECLADIELRAGCNMRQGLFR